MKKSFVWIMFAVIAVFCLTPNIWGQEKSEVNVEAMGAFMDMKWGTDAKTFKEAFKYNDSLSMSGKLFYITGLPLTDTASFGFTAFGFVNPTDAVTRKIKKKQMMNWFLDHVVIDIDPDDFDELLSLFKKKYGKPTAYAESELKHSLGAVFTQKRAFWEAPSIKRKILMVRYNESISEGRIYFAPMTEDDLKDKKEEKKEVDTSKF